MDTTKPYVISKQLVMEAFKAVKANAGAAGIDGESLKEFEKNLKGNLYKIWNRMSSGSYFPPPVKAVEIPKKDGGKRTLGIPTVGDRVAQMVVKKVFEPTVEPYFMEDSYGYRPGKSALDAIAITRKRCWKIDWVLEFDIKGLFDNIDHELLMKAVCKHNKVEWVRLYIERWLKAPLQLPDGSLLERSKGTPQGGVISPVLANLFMHYAFDAWMGRTYPEVQWCRYADDGLIHCKTEAEAESIREALSKRLAECGLEMHPKKTKIVYCKDDNRRGDYSETGFDFLGYTFRGRTVKSKKNKLFRSFTPAVSPIALKEMRHEIKKSKLYKRVDLSLKEIGKRFNPILRGWIGYYGQFHKSGLTPMLKHFNNTLVTWAMRKYRRLKGHKIKAYEFIESIAKRQPSLFVHWQDGKEMMFF